MLIRKDPGTDLRNVVQGNILRYLFAASRTPGRPNLKYKGSRFKTWLQLDDAKACRTDVPGNTRSDPDGRRSASTQLYRPHANGHVELTHHHDTALLQARDNERAEAVPRIWSVQRVVTMRHSARWTSADSPPNPDNPHGYSPTGAAPAVRTGDSGDSTQPVH